MRLHEEPNLFRNAILATAQSLNIPEIYVEKDYWVTIALYRIFSSTASHYTVFKGGTALSKCHKLIERFSEDIDLAVIKEIGDNSNKLKNKLKYVTDAVEKVMPEIEMEGTTNKKGMIRKTAHVYQRLGLGGIFGTVRENIIVEASWLGSFEPHIESTVSSYITDLMINTGQNNLVTLYGMQPFALKALSKERTFCEKIMSLTRFSFSVDPYTDLANKIRHVYDLSMMIKNSEIRAFVENTEFDKMLNTVGTDDIKSFKNNNKWLNNHPAKAMIYNDPDATWSKIRSAYPSFKDLVYGLSPSEEELTNTLKIISERLRKVEWLIRI